MLRFFLLVCFLISTGTAWSIPLNSADKADFSDYLGGRSKPSLGLIDASRLTVNHSFSFGTAFSGKHSLTSSIYASNFTYQLSNPVTLNFLLGVQGSRIGGVPDYGMKTSLIGGFRLDYHPGNKLHLRIEMNHFPASSYPVFDPYYNPSLYPKDR